MAEDNIQTDNSELYKALPVMESFPFTEYLIEVEADDIKPEFDVAPILINELGAFGNTQRLNFYYDDGETTIMISFYQDDLLDLVSISSSIKKLDSVNKDIALGLETTDIVEKIDYVKKSRKFSKLLKLDCFANPPFEAILQELISTNGAILESEIVLELQKLKPKKILNINLGEKEKTAIFSYLNFQLHYAKILLGIVIAAKIY
jgi:hypothetical protein